MTGDGNQSSPLNEAWRKDAAQLRAAEVLHAGWISANRQISADLIRLLDVLRAADVETNDPTADMLREVRDYIRRALQTSHEVGFEDATYTRLEKMAAAGIGASTLSRDAPRR